MRKTTSLPQFQRDRVDGAHVVCHIIALHTITSRHSLHQFAIHIGQRDAQAVIFHLRTNLEVLTFQSFLHAVVEVSDLTFIIGVCQRQHRIFVRHSLERLVQITTHTLSGRVWISILRIEQLQVFQVMHHLVEVIIRNRWLIQHIIIIIVLLQLFTELLYFFLWRQTFSF